MVSLVAAREGASGWPLAHLRPAQSRRLVLVLLVLIAIVPPVYLAHTGGALATGYTIQRLQIERNAWKLRNQQLEVELAKARSLAWVESEAVGRLQMQKPTEQTVVRVDVPPPAVAPNSAARRHYPVANDPLAEAESVDAPWIEGVVEFVAAQILSR